MEKRRGAKKYGEGERERKREKERENGGGRGQRRDGGSVGDREMKAEGAWGNSGGEGGEPVLRSFIKRRRRATRNELLVALV